MNTLKSKLLPQLFIIYLRYLIGGAFVFASIVKIQGKRFTTYDGTNTPLNSPFHLFETLYQSGLYWKFLGVGQVIAGLLLMTQRYSALGALMFLPIISNIFVITVSYGFTGTPYITGLMLIANLLLIIWDWNVIRVLFNKPPVQDVSDSFMKNKVWEFTGLALFLFCAIYRLVNTGYSFMFWVGGCFLIGLIGLIIGLKNKPK